jgi:xanthine dehydrogenase small subunit
MSNPTKISFVLDNKLTEIDFSDSKYTPTTTLLHFLRDQPEHKGVKEGCGEGDCGACTVVLGEIRNNKLEYRAYDSCLIFLPAIHGKQVITTENLGNSSNLHPVQQAIYDFDGSQCGFCTPGFVMSVFALYKQETDVTKDEINDALTGNLCRCTGYKPIVEAAVHVCKDREDDHFCECENEILNLLKSAELDKTIEIITKTQKYFIPFTKKEALRLRKDFPQAIIITGSTDVALRVTKKHELIPEIIDLSLVKDLNFCREDKGSIVFGANLSMEDVRLKSKTKLPALYEMLSVFGSRQIRNRASLGGNIGSASPIGDSIPVLMALDAELVLENLSNSRTVKLRDFIIGYRTTLCKPDELITEVKVTFPENDRIIKSYKVSKRKDLDISTVSACFTLKLNDNKVEDISMFYGGMSAWTKCATKTEAALKGKEWSRENVEVAMKLLAEDYKPISDARSGEKARNIMAANLLLKFWFESGRSA